jgi:hypothetical protein
MSGELLALPFESPLVFCIDFRLSFAYSSPTARRDNSRGRKTSFGEINHAYRDGQKFG